MSKPLLQDMVKPKQIKKPKVWEQPQKLREESSPVVVKERIDFGEVGKDYKKSKGRYFLWFIALVSVLFCLSAVSVLFASVEVKVDPKTKDITLSQNFSASREATKDLLPFSLVVIGGTESKMIQATEEADVKESASGKVLIFNAFGPASQKLDIDTRLEGSNGKIYKTKTKITVPGKVGEAPGSVEVEVYGAEPGPDYNSAPLDFKIFGFKGTPKYSKFYGRSKGELSGGFIGKAPVIKESEKASAVEELKISLRDKLVKKAIAPGFVLFKDAVFLETDDGSVDFASSEDNQLNVQVKGTLYGILFDEKKLTKKIAENNIDKYDGSDVFIYNIKDLVFSLTNKDDISFENIKNINFHLSGPTKFVWKLDVEKFTNDLLGKSKNSFSQILSEYPNINSSNLTINPTWKKTIPTEAKDIKVIINYPE